MSESKETKTTQDTLLTMPRILEMIAKGKITSQEGYQRYIDLREKSRPGAAAPGKKPADTMFYQTVWEKSGKNKGELSAAPLLLFDINEKHREVLRKQAFRVSLVKPGKRFQDHGDQVYEINPQNRDDYVQLVASLKKQGLLPSDVLHLWSVDREPAHGNHNRDYPEKVLTRGVYSIYYLVRAYTLLKLRLYKRFIYIYSEDEGDTEPLKEAVSAYSPSLAFIYPDLLFSTVCIPTASNNEPLEDVIINELGIIGQDHHIPDETRYLGGTRYIKKVIPMELQPPGHVPRLKERGVYLITGGCGRLGFMFARYLSEKYQANLVLTGRSPLDGNPRARIHELKGIGAEVFYHQADTADKQEMKRVMEQIKEKFGHLNGVIHAAGIPSKNSLENKEIDEFKNTLKPKIQGTMILDQVTKEEEMDFFAMFSSASSILGDFGQCDYAVGNRFMDAYAGWRENLTRKKQRHGQSISIDWPLWREGGMHGGEDGEMLYLESSGLVYLEEEPGLQAFENILASEKHRVLVLAGDKNRINQFLKVEGEKDKPALSPREKETQEKGTVTESSIKDHIENDIKNMASALIKLDPKKIISSDNLGNYGFDSIMLKDFSNRLRKTYHIEISPSIFFQRSNLRSLSEYLLEEFGDQMKRYYSAADIQAETSGEKEKILPPVSLSRGYDRTGKGDIAIIGASGIYPGTRNLEEFWQNLAAEKDLVGKIPGDRWDWQAYIRENSIINEDMISKWGGFIPDVDKFDARFFNISRLEAEMMDPQQRLLLQSTWHTVEDAGYRVSDLSGRPVGVFIGAETNDYKQLLTGTSEANPHIGTGNHNAMLANRISFLLNLRGASEIINTACSSSLTAVNHAVRALQSGHCELAIAGGITLMLSPYNMIGANMLGILSPEGRCKTFDKDANGYVKGEGVGTILLKPLSRAAADGDHIYAVIKGIAVNHGGKANSLTAPNSGAQSALLISAYEDAGISPDTITYIEVHGTGTELGDPVEIDGIKKAFKEMAKKSGKITGKTHYCGLGTVKTNIGHLEAASGIAGVIKTILAMKHKILPGILHLKELNPYIDLRDTPFYVVKNTRPWEPLIDSRGKPVPRRAGVSSFGFGGSNVHIVLEEYEPPSTAAAGQSQAPQIIILSAKNKERLKEYARNMLDFLEKNTNNHSSLSISMKQSTGRDYRQEVQKYLFKTVSRILNVTENDIHMDEDITGYGFEPVHLSKLANQVNETYKIDTAPDLFVKYSSIRSAAQYLCNRYADKLPGKSTCPGVSPGGKDIHTGSCPLRLQDIAYTLQVGRESMDERMAMIVSSPGELKEKLHEYCRGETDIDDFYRGNAKENRENPDTHLLLEGEEGKAYLENILRSGKLDKVARSWAAGVEIDWKLTGSPPGVTPHRISLPTYPFARDRYWLPEPGDSASATVSRQHRAAGIHPLIDRNISDFEEQKFTTQLRGSEFYIKDHVLGGQKILPGNIFIEMARAAARIAGRANVLEIKNITWASPTPVNEKSSQLRVRLLPYPHSNPERDSLTAEFEVNSTRDREDSPLLVHARGMLVYHPPVKMKEPAVEIVDIETVKARCSRTIEGFAAYSLLRSWGLSYGPALQPLQVMNYNETEALARLQLPPAANESFQDFTLHPSLLEGALQILRLWIDKSAGGSISHGLYWPFKLEKVELIGSIPADCYVYALLSGNNDNRVEERTFNICFTDTHGHVSVKMKDLQLKSIPSLTRPTRQEQAAQVETGNIQPSSIYYRSVWQPAPFPEHQAPHEGEGAQGRILLFDENEEMRDILTRRLEIGTVILVKPGPSFQKKGDALYEIDPHRAEDYGQLIKTLEKQKHTPGKIIHLWSRQEWDNNEKAIEQQLNKSVYSLFFLTRALMEQKLEKSIQLLYLFFHPLTGDNRGFQPQYAGINGFARTIRLENPRFVYKTIELVTSRQKPSELSASPVIPLILKEFSAADQEVEARYDVDKKQRYIKRLQLIAPGKKNNPIRLKEKGVYLITGGMGGVGQIFAKYLARKFKARLVLTGRSTVNGDKGDLAAGIEKITTLGSEMVYIKADLSGRREVNNLVKEIKKRYERIDGVLHCAGVTRDAFVLKKTREQIKEVLAAKVYGTVNLDEALKEEKLDFFVMFSSLSAVLGNVGQCDYAYANGFMDGFVQWREALHRSRERYGAAISINWPYWQEGGMELPQDERARLEELTGAAGITADQGIKAFKYVLQENISHCTLFYGIHSRVEQAVAQIFSPANNRETGKSTPRSTPLTVNPKELYDKTGKFLQSIFVEILKLPEEQIEPAARFEELGIDSLIINMFNAKFAKEFFPTPRTLLFEYQTLEELTAYFVRSHQAELVNLFNLKDKVPSPPGPSAWPLGDTTAAWTELPSLKKKYADGSETRRQYGRSLLYQQEDIAIIGLSGRYPGAKNLEEFWTNLKQGKDCIIEIPAERWDYRDYFHPDPKKGKIYTKWGGFLDDIDKFDPLIFNISPREAELIDPQERIFLETVRASLEDAGYTSKEIDRLIKKENGPDIGLFVGTTNYSYYLFGPRGNLEQILSYPWSIANRVSFVFNFQGPSMPVDTACSSSLTALHLACESLKKEECHMAITGGVNLYLHPSKYLGMCSRQMLSPTGKCHTFGKASDGFIPGEGVGAMLLKPLSAALRDHDHIYAVIKGSAVNHGGRTNGYTVPNPNAQAGLIVQACKNARIDPRTIGYIEAHGTGTALGDPIEIQGLIKAYEKYTRGKQYCSIGSVKSNIGHLESAAGIAGLTKIILQMKHRQLVPSLHARELNPNIDFERSPFYVQQELSQWKSPYPLRAGISSFGAGGANAHVILEEAPQPVIGYSSPDTGETGERIKPEYMHSLPGKGPYLILLSAKNEERLKEYAGNLKEFLENLENTGENQGDISPGDMAYTLQVGRESMNQRIAVKVSGIKELKEKLLRYCRGETEIEEFYSGNIKTDKKMLDSFFKGKTGEELINKLLKQQDLPRLAWLWVSGMDIDWRSLYHGEVPRRISLPTYPLARKRCWISQTPENQQLPREKTRLHPLIDGIAPGESLEYANGLVFQKTFRETDWVLENHQVMGRRILPGVAYLEMAYAAFSQTRKPGTFNINRVVLLQPLSVQNEPKQSIIIIEQYNSKYRFEIRSKARQQTIVHAQGEFRIHDTAGEEKERIPSPLPIEAIKSRCTLQVDGKEMYTALLGVGLRYGPNFQGVKQIFANAEAGEALGLLSLPPGDKTGPQHRGYTLHPTLMDGSLQTIAGLISCHVRHDTPRVPMLPFSFEKVEILHPLSEQAYAYVKPVDSKQGHHYHVDLLDETGRVCVKLHDVTLRPVKETIPGKPGKGEALLYKPRWIPCPLPPGPGTRVQEIKKANLKESKAGRQKVLLVYPPDTMGLDKALADAHGQAGAEVIGIPIPASVGHDPDSTWEKVGKPGQLNCIYFLGGIQGDTADILDIEVLTKSQEQGVLSLYRLVKTLIHRGFTREALQIKVITNDTLQVLDRQVVIPNQATLHGFAGSMAKEHPRWQISCLDIGLKGLKSGKTTDNREMQHLVNSIIAEPPHKFGSLVALRNRQRYACKIEPIILPAQDNPPASFRKHGVYLILGGAGGIGLELGRHLAETAQARLILVGRSELKEKQKKKISQIETAGGEILYLQTDATRLESMKSAVAKAKSRFGTINGVIHSAIVLKDKTIALMDEETLRTVMAPKVIGSVILYRVLQKEPLDFMMFFSSSQSFTCSPGQGNYAAACTFKDAFAHYIGQKAPFPVKIINWGYWGTVGVVASEYFNKRLTAQGVLSITPEEGMAAVHRVLTRRTHQFIVLKMETRTLEKMDIDLEHPVLLYPERIPSLIAKVVPGIKHLLTDLITGDSLQDREAFTALQEFMENLLWNVFRQMGVFQKAGEQYSKKYLKQQLKIVPGYDRLYEALLDILARAGFISINENDILTSRESKEKDPGKILKKLENKKDRLMERFPVIAPHIRLLYTCVRAYPQVLSGQVNHMDVMFPGGSLQLLEDVYKGNEVSDFFNRLTARAVQTYIKLRLQKDPGTEIQVLEVGAGTGGTTGCVLETIKDYGKNIRFIYSDLSKKFAQHGEQTFAHLYPFMKFQVLDIEKDPEQQHFQPGSMDLILAVNVIHATQKIANTINQLKKLLKTNGLLMINESTRKQDFSTLTFGLTDGWWFYRDEADRIKGSPLLSPGKWRQMLEANGFEYIRMLGIPHGPEENLSQAVIIGESNGEVIVEKTAAPGIKNQKTQVSTASSTPVPPTPPGLKTAKVTGSPIISRQDHVKEIITGIFSQLLHIPRSELETDASFQDYGVDSLMAVEIINKINEALNLDLSSTDLFNFSTPGELNHHICRELGRELPDTPKSAEIREQQGHTSIEPPGTVAREDGDTATGGESEPAKKYGGEDEPIAIIGISCQFPDARNVNQFWDNLAAGKNSVGQIPPDRWNIKSGSGEEEQKAMQWGAFLSDIDQFDAEFFHIPDAEAEVMDPQQRLFLQEAYRALEDAGYTEKQLRGKRCGVFAGCSNGDYAMKITEEIKNPVEYSFIGNASSILPARVTYYFNLKGPALAIDTACSSSLVALHLACESIRSGSCEMAAAGGVMISTTPLFHSLAAKSGMLSPTGQCKAFDDTADGFVPGEGVGVAVVKPLSGALLEKDHIYGIIKGSGINHNGKTLGISAPSGPAQIALQCDVYDRFNIDPAALGYVETHGTGTPLGDPIEINALSGTFRKYTQKKQFCALGSVKTNIGHTLAAAGIASVIKVLLAFKYKRIPPSLHFKTPNRRICFKDTPFYVNTRLTDWPTPGGSQPRRAAVSAFGFNGTNAHIILEEFPGAAGALTPLSAPPPAITPPYYFIPISAKTRQALEQKYKDLLQRLNPGIKAPMGSIAYTLHMRRSHFALRSALLVKDESDLKQKLRELCETGHTRDYLVNEIRAGNSKANPGQQQQGNQLIDELLRTQLPGNEYKDKLMALAELYVNGLDSDLDWKSFFQEEAAYCVSLPTYPFNGKRYWFSSKNPPQKILEDQDIKELIRKLELGEITISEAESLTEGIL